LTSVGDTKNDGIKNLNEKLIEKSETFHETEACLTSAISDWYLTLTANSEIEQIALCENSSDAAVWIISRSSNDPSQTCALKANSGKYLKCNYEKKNELNLDNKRDTYALWTVENITKSNNPTKLIALKNYQTNLYLSAPDTSNLNKLKLTPNSPFPLCAMCYVNSELIESSYWRFCAPVIESYLLKRGTIRWQKRYFAFNGSIISYWKNLTDANSHKKPLKYYTLKSLKQIRLDKDRPTEFELDFLSGAIRKFKAGNFNECCRWIKSLNQRKLPTITIDSPERIKNALGSPGHKVNKSLQDQNLFKSKTVDIELKELENQLDYESQTKNQIQNSTNSKQQITNNQSNQAQESDRDRADSEWKSNASNMDNQILEKSQNKD